MIWRISRIALAVVLASFVLATAALVLIDVRESPTIHALWSALSSGG